MNIKEKIRTKIKKNKISGNNHSFDIRKSLRFRLCLTMIIVVVVIIVLCWGINKLFLAGFYENSKINAIEDAYNFINSKLGIMKKILTELLKKY